MKKRCILWLLMSVIGLPLIAQNIIYSNLKELLAQNGDTTSPYGYSSFRKEENEDTTDWLNCHQT